MYMIHMIEQEDDALISIPEVRYLWSIDNWLLTAFLQYPLTIQHYKRIRELDQIKEYIDEQLPSKILTAD